MEHIRYTPGEVYKNILEMTKYRNIEITTPILEENNLSKSLSFMKYIQMDGIRKYPKTDKKVVIMLFAPSSSYSEGRPLFEKLFNHIIYKGKKIISEEIEVMFISEKPLSNNIIKFIKEQLASHNKLHIEYHTYDPFKINIIHQESIVSHTIMDKDEANQVLNYFYKTSDKLPIISVNDPPIIWIGGKPGDIIKIDRISETTGESVGYRLCRG